VTGGGYPLDATWYQTIKGIVAATAAVRDGGTIVVASALSEGIGSPAFQALIGEAHDLDHFMRDIRRPGWFRPEQWQLEEFALAARKARIMLYTTGLPLEVQQTLFLEPATSVEGGVADALQRHGDQATVTVMPHGPYVIPIVQP
jgi:nickel-dependent lactate racemase